MTLDAQLPVSSDRPEKIRRVARILEAADADAVRLTSSAALAWLLDGARTTIPIGAPAVFSARVDRAGEIVVTGPRNEADRLAAEELGGCSIDVVDWFAPITTPRPDEIAEHAIAAELRAARASLLPAERERYRALGLDAARAMTAALRGARPDMTEHALAGRVAGALYERGIEPDVVLVAGASRGDVQHPLPTAAPLGRRAMAVATAVRDGLHLSLTRWADFDGRPLARAIYDVEADAWSATRPGRSLSEVIADIGSAYAAHGLDDGSTGWRMHHQGGPAGYAGRDPKALPDSPEIVAAGQPFAWNPWTPGAKVEDTIVVDGPGECEVLSTDPEWPTIDVRGRRRPDVLDLS